MRQIENWRKLRKLLKEDTMKSIKAEITLIAMAFGYLYWKEREKRKEEKQDSRFKEMKKDIKKIDEKIELLTSREKEILVEVCHGLSSKQIGKKLRIAEGTVKKHRQNVYEKLKVKKVTELAPFFNILITTSN